MSTGSGLCLYEATGTPLEYAADGICLLAEGKVREIYDIREGYLVLHATDRISGEHSSEPRLHKARARMEETDTSGSFRHHHENGMNSILI